MNRGLACGIPRSAAIRLWDLKNLRDAFQPESDFHLSDEEYKQARLRVIREERVRTRRLGGQKHRAKRMMQRV